MGLGASFCWTRLMRVQLRDEGFTLRNIVRLTYLAGVLMALAISALVGDSSDARLQKAYRFQQGGWTYIHLEGSPADLGYQHGYLLAPEVQDAFEAIKLFDVHQSGKDWEFFRAAARQMLWPHIDREYQQELQGIADGVKAKGVNLHAWDILAPNHFEEGHEHCLQG